MARQIELAGGGRLVMEEEGGRIRFYASRPEDKRGLYKVWICGAGGRMLLGTMMPQGGQLNLCRTLSYQSLRGAGCYPTIGGEVVMAFPFHQKPKQVAQEERPPSGWQSAQRPEERFGDGLLRACIQQNGFLIKEGEEGAFYLACPHQIGSGFPLVPIFCFVSCVTLEGRNYLMWKFDGEGRPIF